MILQQLLNLPIASNGLNSDVASTKPALSWDLLFSSFCGLQLMYCCAGWAASLVFRCSDSQLRLPASHGFLSSKTNLGLPASLGFLSFETHLVLTASLGLLELGLLAIEFPSMRKSYKTCQVMVLLFCFNVWKKRINYYRQISQQTTKETLYSWCCWSWSGQEVVWYWW